MTDPVPAPGPLDPAAIQARVAETRAQLLGGRGTGASQTEVDGRTRARPRLGGEPTPQHLAAVARQTAIARGDAAAIALDNAATRDRLADSLQAIHARLRPSEVAGRRVRAATAAGWARLRSAQPASSAAGSAAALTVALLLRRRRSRRNVPGAARPGPAPGTDRPGRR